MYASERDSPSRPGRPFGVAAVIALLASGCPTEELGISRQVMREAPSDGSSGACFAGLPTRGNRLRIEPPGSGEVVAGLKTSYQAGAPPFPCNRWTYMPAQGVFDFELAAVLAANQGRELIAAQLELVGFRAVEPIHVLAPPPRTDPNVGALPERRTHCQVRVETAAEAWDPRDEQPLRKVSSRPLSWPKQHIQISNEGASDFWVDVTPEVQDWISGVRPQHGFVVVPDDQAAFDGPDSNSCLGYFRFVMRLIFSDE